MESNETLIQKSERIREMEEEIADLNSTVKYLQAQINAYQSEEASRKIELGQIDLLRNKLKMQSKENEELKRKVEKLGNDLKRKRKQIQEERENILEEIKSRVSLIFLKVE